QLLPPDRNRLPRGRARAARSHREPDPGHATRGQCEGQHPAQRWLLCPAHGEEGQPAARQPGGVHGPGSRRSQGPPHTAHGEKELREDPGRQGAALTIAAAAAYDRLPSRGRSLVSVTQFMASSKFALVALFITLLAMVVPGHAEDAAAYVVSDSTTGF